MKCCREEGRHRIGAEALKLWAYDGTRDEIPPFVKRMQPDNLSKHVKHTIYSALDVTWSCRPMKKEQGTTNVKKIALGHVGEDAIHINI